MTKICSKCKKIKPLEDFYKYKNSKDGRQGYCKDCYKEYQQSPKIKDYHKRYAKTEKGRLILRQAEKKYKASGKGKKTQRRHDKKYTSTKNGKETRKRANGRYNQSSKGIQTTKRKAAIRRTREANSTGSYTVSEWYKLCEYYNFHCLGCNKKFPFDKLTFDHVKPISKGGTNFIFNAQPLCKSCNSKKKDKEIDYRQTLPSWINCNNPRWIQNQLF